MRKRNRQTLKYFETMCYMRYNMRNIYDIIVDMMTADNIEYCHCYLCQRRDR